MLRSVYVKLNQLTSFDDLPETYHARKQPPVVFYCPGKLFISRGIFFLFFFNVNRKQLRKQKKPHTQKKECLRQFTELEAITLFGLCQSNGLEFMFEQNERNSDDACSLSDIKDEEYFNMLQQSKAVAVEANKLLSQIKY